MRAMSPAPPRSLRSCLLLAFALAPGFAAAQSAAKRPTVAAYTDPAKTDEDFPFQGEYEGHASPGGGNDKAKRAKLGLQVVAEGEGKFRGVLLEGGLPGAQNLKPPRREVPGQREGGAVVLAGEGLRIALERGAATLRDGEGKPLGTLRRVERRSPTLGARPPKGALVLFGGPGPGGAPAKPADAWDERTRVTDEGLLAEGATTKEKLGSGRYHVEFRTPYKPAARAQGRGNSGVYIQGRYEVQILDSFGLEGKNNEAGGIYEVKDPAGNMAFPPLVWQTYDIDFTAAKWEGDKKVANARMTVRLNGVVVQDDTELPGPTRSAPVKESADAGPLYLQEHGNPVRFRNVWFAPRPGAR